MVGTSIIAGLVVTSVKIELAAFPFQEMADVIFPGGEAVILTGLLFYFIKIRKWNMYRLVGVVLTAGVILKTMGAIV